MDSGRIFKIKIEFIKEGYIYIVNAVLNWYGLDNTGLLLEG